MAQSNRKKKIVTLDGRTGEGGGQLVRVAVGLAALTGTPIRIENVRGNRNRGLSTRGGGLKAQHVSCIQCLANATGAEVTGCSIGSNFIEFKSTLSPLQILNRNVQVKADTAASVLLVFQAILPFLIFASDKKETPIAVTIHGGTNTSFSLSFEYLDQVLLPALERFGVKVERKLQFRGWSHGTAEVGSIKFVIAPLGIGQSLKDPAWPLQQGTITKIDVSLIVPRDMQMSLKSALLSELSLTFSNVAVNFVIVEDSRHRARIYTLLVAHTSTDLRFGRDWLYDEKIKEKSVDTISVRIAQKVVDQLDAEIRKGGVVDAHLQDQLVVFQALAEGRSSIPGSEEALHSERERIERADEPFGDGSMHTKTARWVTSQLLPRITWIDRGRICEGAAWKASDAKDAESLEKLHIS